MRNVKYFGLSRIQDFWWNPDPDPGFNDQKLTKVDKFKGKFRIFFKDATYFFWDFYKEFKTPKEVSGPSEYTGTQIQLLKTFSYFFALSASGVFALLDSDPDLLTQLHLD